MLWDSNYGILNGCYSSDMIKKQKVLLTVMLDGYPMILIYAMAWNMDPIDPANHSLQTLSNYKSIFQLKLSPQSISSLNLLEQTPNNVFLNEMWKGLCQGQRNFWGCIIYMSKIKEHDIL